jgi:transcriptional regulator with XRE-family HTH domain
VPRLNSDEQWIADREAMGWTRTELARLLGVTVKAVTNWEEGRTPQPADVRHWLRGMARHIRENPPPDRTYTPRPAASASGG